MEKAWKSFYSQIPFIIIWFLLLKLSLRILLKKMSWKSNEKKKCIKSNIIIKSITKNRIMVNSIKSSDDLGVIVNNIEPSSSNPHFDKYQEELSSLRLNQERYSLRKMNF